MIARAVKPGHGFRQSSAHCAVHSNSADRDKALQRPGGVIGNIGDEAQLAAGPQDAGELRHRLILNEAALPMPPFRPGIGMDQVDARQRRFGQPRDQARRRRRNADGCFAGRCFRSPASALAMPLTKGSTPIKPRRGRSRACAIMIRRRQSRFRARNLADRHRKQRAQLGGRGPGEIDRQTRQQRLQKPRLARPQLVALAPAEEGARSACRCRPSLSCSAQAQHPVNTGRAEIARRAVRHCRLRDHRPDGLSSGRPKARPVGG